MATTLPDAQVPIQGMLTLRYVGDDGKTFDIAPHEANRFDVKPLGFKELVQAVATKHPEIPLVILNASAPATETGLDRDGPNTLRINWVVDSPVIAYGLVDGGWLPLPWAHKRIALLDRNVVIELENLQSAGCETLGAGNPGWLTKWLGMDTDTVSPMLFALEGRHGRLPTDFEMRAELNRATKALLHVLPGTNVETVGPGQRRAMRHMLLGQAEYYHRATRLLLQAIPLVVDRAKPESRKHIEAKVLQIARDEQIPPDGLAVLALLSCIYDSNPPISTHRAATPGRAVLKPSRAYSEKNAYNALSDLFFLELLFNTIAMAPEIQPVLYTRDIGIAAFWAVLQPCKYEVRHASNGKSGASFTFSLAQGLFPSLSDDEVLDLKARIYSLLGRP